MDRNPSPPPEIEGLKDSNLSGNIGSTVFSQNWLFQILLKVIKNVENSDGDEQNMEEIDKHLEEEMCTLWDMSADTEVAHFLVDFKARDLFLGCIEKTKSPRLVEIVIGIFGNMAYFDDICQHFTEKEEFVANILQLVGSSDTPTLFQIMRLLRVSVSNESCSSIWLEKMQGNELFLNSINFMLENSLNGELLSSTLNLLDDILDKNEAFCKLLANENFIGSVAASANQLLVLKETESLDKYWLILHELLSDETTQLLTTDKLYKTIMNHCKCYLEILANGEDTLPPNHRIAGLTAAIACLQFLMFKGSNKEAEVTAIKSIGILDYLSKLSQTISEIVTEADDSSSLQISTLNETIKNFCKIIA